jgi:hypothetical protein
MHSALREVKHFSRFQHLHSARVGALQPALTVDRDQRMLAQVQNSFDNLLYNMALA